MIELRNVSYTIKEKEIISNFSFNFEKGKCYGLIGSSGCGKTTLIKLISQILPITKGLINYSFENTESKSNSLLLYPNLTAVFQDFRLFPHLSVYENIILPIKSNNFNIDESAINNLCSYFNVSSILDNKPYEISTGQRQRVAFIRAVLLKSNVLLLDEITSALDIESVQLITAYLNKLKSCETILIIATHSISFCKKVCEEYLFIDKGKLNFSGLISDLDVQENTTPSDRFKQFLNSY